MARQFRAQPPTVKAIQFTGENLVEIGQFLSNDQPAARARMGLVYDYTRDDGLVVKHLSIGNEAFREAASYRSEADLEPGDWLVVTDYEYKRLTDAQFREHYEEVDREPDEPMEAPIVDEEPRLGLASTRDLLTEIAVRMEIGQNSLNGRTLASLCRQALEGLDDHILNYSTVGGHR